MSFNERTCRSIYASIDLWAASVTLHELLTLEQPFVGNSLDELTQAIHSKRETPLRERRDECSARSRQLDGDPLGPIGR